EIEGGSDRVGQALPRSPGRSRRRRTRAAPAFRARRLSAQRSNRTAPQAGAGAREEKVAKERFPLSRKEWIMQLNPYLTFNGQCEAAFKFYEKVLGGKIDAMLTYGGSPMADNTPPDWRDKIMHTRLTVGGNVVSAPDAPPHRYPTVPRQRQTTHRRIGATRSCTPA